MADRRSLKAEQREAKHRKAQYAPKGGTGAGQVARTRTARGYVGSAKRFVRLKKQS